MGSASIEVKLQELDKLVRKLQSYTLSDSDKIRLLTSLGMIIEEQTKERFDTKRDPDGNEWRNITDKYRKYLARHFPGSRPPLEREGLLRMSIESRIKGTDTIVVGSPMEYAGYHQDAKSEKRRRMFLGFGTDNINELGEAVDVFMREHVA